MGFLREAAVVAYALTHLAWTQTILGQDLDESTVAPAAVQLDGRGYLGAERRQLTDAVLANLTKLHLSNINLFAFGNARTGRNGTGIASGTCRVFPGDAAWPSEAVWRVLDLLAGGALIKTVPIGAACYKSHEAFDAERCEYITTRWTEGSTHFNDPTSAMSPLYQGLTCMPSQGNTSTCELGGFPPYVVNVTNVAQIQLAVNFARNTNLRLVVRNTGHDFLGKSIGAGALSIWTHHLKDWKFLPDYNTPSYRGPAFELGAGVQVRELYELAHTHNVTAVGGECKDVGVTGGYTAGGGHTPLASLVGMASDQVLSIRVVTPDGRLVTADERQNRHLFWAIRGGGGSTWGVVTSMAVKVHPSMVFSGMTFTLASGSDKNITDAQFWAAVELYWRNMKDYADQNAYGYSTIFSRGAGAGYVWSMRPWLHPNTTLANFSRIVAPLLTAWARLGIVVEAEYFEHDNFHDTWTSHFPTQSVGRTTAHTASRLFPRANWENEARLEATLAALRRVADAGSAMIMFNLNGAAPPGTPASATNPAWRDAVFFLIIGSSWPPDASPDAVRALYSAVTTDWMAALRDVTPGSGGYLNEGDVMEPDFGRAYYGHNYPALLAIKDALDPWHLFWAQTAVGSERWRLADQPDWITLQTGRLCKV